MLIGTDFCGSLVTGLTGFHCNIDCGQFLCCSKIWEKECRPANSHALCVSLTLGDPKYLSHAFAPISHAWLTKCEFLAHRPIKCKFSSQFVKTACMIGSGQVIFGNARNSSETFGYLREPSEVVGHLRKLG